MDGDHSERQRRGLSHGHLGRAAAWLGGADFGAAASGLPARQHRERVRDVLEAGGMSVLYRRGLAAYDGSTLLGQERVRAADDRWDPREGFSAESGGLAMRASCASRR